MSAGAPPTLAKLTGLAVPLIASHAGSQLMSLVDTAMIGRLGSAELAGTGIANGIYFTITLVGLGCVLGMDAPITQAVGANERAKARRILWQGLRVALLASIPLTILVALSPAILAPSGVKPDIARAARDYLWGRVPNVLPFLAFVAVRSYLQALGATRPMIIAVVLANVTNVFLNALLMWGDAALVRVHLPAIGLPALGVVGAAISSTVCSTLSLGVLALAVRAVETPPDPDRRRTDPALVRTIFALGGPVGIQLLAEVGVFSLVGLLTGRFNEQDSSAHQIAITLASFSFCVTIGIAAATSVLVGHAIGRADTASARRAGALGLLSSAGFMSVSGAFFLLAPRVLARVLTDDPAVIEAAVPLIRIAGLFALSDGTQATAAGALRGAGDARVPLYANLIGHYVVGLPVAVGLGFGASLGVMGLWWGLCAGLTAVAIGLAIRFFALTARPIERV